MAERVGVMRRGELILVEEKHALMQKLGKRQLTLTLATPLTSLPAALAAWSLELRGGGNELAYTFDAHETSGISALLKRLNELEIGFKDLNSHESSLEEIFVSLVSERAGEHA